MQLATLQQSDTRFAYKDNAASLFRPHTESLQLDTRYGSFLVESIGNASW